MGCSKLTLVLAGIPSLGDFCCPLRQSLHFPVTKTEDVEGESVHGSTEPLVRVSERSSRHFHKLTNSMNTLLYSEYYV